MKFEFDKRTGMMIPKKNEQIYFASSVGGGLRVDDRKHNVKFIVERNGKITNIAGIYDSSVNLYDFNDARVIADRVARMFGRNHKYADYHYFLKGVVRESEVMDFDGYINEMWGTDVKTDRPGEDGKEDKFHTKEELREYLKSEIKKQGENVVIQNLDVSQIENLKELFENICGGVKSLNLSGWKVSNAKIMSYMFYNCWSLSSLDLSGWNTSNVNNMCSMFSGCKNLESLDVSGWDTSNVKYMTDMFSECKSLKSLDLSGWDTSNVEQRKGMFNGCSNCKIIKPSPKHLWRDKFQSLTQLIRYLDSEITMQGENVIIQNLDVSLIEDLGGLFKNITKVKTLDLSGWKTSNVQNMSDMFYNCNSLESLDISGWNTSNVKDMGRMFFDCESLKSLDISDWDTSNVEDMVQMFSLCKNLKLLDISDWDTSKVKNMSCMFKGCSAPYKTRGNKIIWA